MTYFAKLSGNIVINVIIADQEFVNGLPDSQDYVETNYGGIGWTYVDGVFIEPPLSETN